MLKFELLGAVATGMKKMRKKNVKSGKLCGESQDSPQKIVEPKKEEGIGQRMNEEKEESGRERENMKLKINE